jgi:hypothetical protein
VATHVTGGVGPEEAAALTTTARSRGTCDDGSGSPRHPFSTLVGNACVVVSVKARAQRTPRASRRRMARGWESKAVEAQQDEASSRTPSGPPITREDAERRAQLATLSLARARAEADLQVATAGAHRDMLTRAIEDLDRRIASLTR